MSILSLSFVVVGLFLAGYAMVLLFGRSEENARGRREGLGCGFVLLAGFVWGLSFGWYLDDRWTGLRLGFAVALLLPAVATLLQPGRGRTLVAALTLGFAVLLGASALPGLRSALSPSQPAATAQQVHQTMGELQDATEDTEDYIDQLRHEREDLKERLRARGYADFDALAEDPTAYAMLEELAELNRLIEKSEQWLSDARQNLERLRVAERRIDRLARGELAMGIEVDPEEVNRILREARTPPPSGPTTVEQHVQREELRDLFQSEF